MIEQAINKDILLEVMSENLAVNLQMDIISASAYVTDDDMNKAIEAIDILLDQICFEIANRIEEN